MDVPTEVGDLRLLAASSIADALDRAEALRIVSNDDPAVLYLLAELSARLGRPHEALDLIEDAQRKYRSAGLHLDAERCEVGRIAVLDDLGRHDDAVRVASSQLARLARTPPSNDVIELEVRVLGNRAFCYETIGRFTDAAHDGEVAVLKAKQLGDDLLVARLHVNRANVLDMLGRTEEALIGLRAANRTLNAEGERDDRVTVATHIGRTLCRRGEYDEGLDWFRRAEQLVEVGTDDECDLQVETADALAGLGALPEALARYLASIAMLSNRPLSWLEGRAWLGAGLCHARLGATDSARDALLASISAFQAADNTPSKLTALLELATLEGESPHTRQFAMDEARRALALADVESTPFHSCIAHLKLAEFSSGGDSERHLRSALRLAERVGLAPLTMRVEQRLGHLLMEHQRMREAAPHVRAAAAHAELLSNRIHHRTLLRSFPTETATCFQDHVELLLHEGDYRQAFEVADRARSRSLRDLVPHRSTLRTHGGTRGLEAELHAIYDRLLGVTERLAPAARSGLERRARELEIELDRADFELATDDKRGDATRMAASTRVSYPDFTLLYLERHGQFDVLVRDAAGNVEHHVAVARPIDIDEALARFHSDGRRALALRSSRVTVTENQVDRHLRRLGERLLRPICGRLLTAGSEPASVLVLPTGRLHAVPFSALGCGNGQLLDYAAVCVAASADLYDSCRLRTATSSRAVFVGVSAAGISGVLDEIESLTGLLPATVLVEDEATIAAVSRETSGAGIVHLASHGLFRQDAPLRSGVRLADGWLTAAAVAEIDLTGTLVVLSACDTGRSHVTDGEEVLGLQYGFFASGASAVVMSLWPAHDGVTASLMKSFYTALAAGATPAAALRQAQLALRASDPHPWWWAAFVAAGAG